VRGGNIPGDVETWLGGGKFGGVNLGGNMLLVLLLLECDEVTVMLFVFIVG
jgi:hypothetical protein